VKLVDPNGETTVNNNTKHFLIIRGEDKETHAVASGEKYNTAEHGLEAIDGILMSDGSVFKTNNGNKDATFTVSENEEGGFNVESDSIGKKNDSSKDSLKRINNFFFPKNEKKLSGYYKKGDDSPMGGSWWNTKTMKRTEITDEDTNNSQSWDSKLDEFKRIYPNGLREEDIKE